MIARILYHTAGLAFLAWVVLVPLKWAFLAGLALFGLCAWDTRPGSEERRQRTEQARDEEPVTAEEGVRDEVNRASTVAPRLVGRAWLDATVRASNPTGSIVDLEAVSCSVLFAPDMGPRHTLWNRGPWRIRLEPGAGHVGEVSFGRLEGSGSAERVALAEHRCRLHVRVVPAPMEPSGSPSNPFRLTPTGYRMEARR